MSGVYFGVADLREWENRVRTGHFLDGFSAKLTAKSWLDTGGFPPALATRLQAMGAPWASLTPLLVFPEHKVALPGGNAPSQSDVWCLARHDAGLMSLAIEGKKEEGFGADLAQWQREMASGRKTRLAFLADLLGLTLPLPQDLRYQFLHRMASAVIEAKHFHADSATLLVQSWSDADTGFADFARFVALFGGTAPTTTNTPVSLGVKDGITRYVLWVRP